MRAPDSATMLDAWEGGLGRPPAARALALLSAALPDADEALLGQLPLGARDTLLLDLREAWFGTQLDAVADCPGCGERLEARFPVDAIRDRTAPAPPAEIEVHAEGRSLRCRLPTTADLLAIPAGADAATARASLLATCVSGGDGTAAAPLLGEAAAAQISAALAAADPQAAIDIALDCPACGTHFAAAFDVASWLLAEVDRWAHRVLGDVATLARAFGWREPDVLALGPARRRAYLELARR